jgi:hypothetical protein
MEVLPCYVVNSKIAKRNANALPDAFFSVAPGQHLDQRRAIAAHSISLIPIPCTNDADMEFCAGRKFLDVEKAQNAEPGFAPAIPSVSFSLIHDAGLACIFLPRFVNAAQQDEGFFSPVGQTRR